MGFGGWGKGKFEGKFGGGWSPWQPMCLGKHQGMGCENGGYAKIVPSKGK